MNDDEVYEKIEATKLSVKQNKTLRDEFAMAALTGLIARAGSWDLDMDLDVVINRAFYIADRAMKVRNK